VRGSRRTLALVLVGLGIAAATGTGVALAACSATTTNAGGDATLRLNTTTLSGGLTYEAARVAAAWTETSDPPELVVQWG
jgi:hypothetical protein